MSSEWKPKETKSPNQVAADDSKLSTKDCFREGGECIPSNECESNATELTACEEPGAVCCKTSAFRSPLRDDLLGFDALSIEPRVGVFLALVSLPHPPSVSPSLVLSLLSLFPTISAFPFSFSVSFYLSLSASLLFQFSPSPSFPFLSQHIFLSISLYLWFYFTVESK